MKTTSAGLAAHLAGAVTTLCSCWCITRRDGVILAVTDHDRPVQIQTTTFDPVSGLTASEQVAAADLTVGGGECLGALASAAVTEADIAAGRYDGATVDIYLVNWATPGQWLWQRSGLIGEITRRDGAFIAEVRSLSQGLDQPQGRIYQHRCDADLGDRRCGVDLTRATYRGTCGVTQAAGRGRLVVAGLSAFADGWFTGGRLQVTSGGNAGLVAEIRLHQQTADVGMVTLWQPAPVDFAVGDAAG